MAMYKCPTLGDCDRANAGEIFERGPGEELKCPGCGIQLEAQQVQSSAGEGRRKPLIAATAAAVVLALGAGGYYFYGKSHSAAPAPVAAEPAPAAEAAAPTPVAPAATPGMAPPEAETLALRRSGEESLTKGDAQNAELASQRAATNELLKLGIAKLGQGKLDEAEKDFEAARARDPKQPLVYYNTAILRLRQGRTDDALKELEASFLNGFSYFDKMDADTDLDGLRKDPRFAELVARYRSQTK